MLTLNKTTNVNGISSVEVDGKPVQVAYMSASINVNGAFNATHSIQNKDMFEEYKGEVLEDLATFDNYVYQTAQGSDMQAELDTASGGGADAKAVLTD